MAEGCARAGEFYGNLKMPGATYTPDMFGRRSIKTVASPSKGKPWSEGWDVLFFGCDKKGDPSVCVAVVHKGNHCSIAVGKPFELFDAKLAAEVSRRTGVK